MLNNSLLEQIRTDSSASKVFLILLKMLLKKGKPAKKILYQSCLYIKILKRTSSLKYIYQAVRNLLPLASPSSSSSSFGSNIRSSSIKPVPILPRRSSFIAINRLIQGATQRTERSFSLRSYREIVEAYDKKGFAFKKKIEWHTRCYAGYTKSNIINDKVN